MRFHTFGNPENKALVLIHGLLTPWQMWDYQIDKFKNDFYIIVPALDGHTEEEPSDFISVRQEANIIENYLIENLSGKVYAICGISMGAAISGIIWNNNRVKIEKIIMDGAPFGKIPKIMHEFRCMHGTLRRNLKRQ